MLHSATGLEIDGKLQHMYHTTTNATAQQLHHLLPPALNKNLEPVTGKTKTVLRKENKSRQIATRLEQPSRPNWWTTHKGNFELPLTLPPVPHYLNSMRPRGLALHHPAAPLLNGFATLGCPTETGKPWTIRQMQAAIDRGPHKSTLLDDARTQLRKEVREKIANGQARLVNLDDIKHDPPPN